MVDCVGFVDNDLDDRRQFKRRKFDRRFGRSRDRLHLDRVIRVCHNDVYCGEREVLGLPASTLRGGCWRVDRDLRGNDWRGTWVSLVQLPSRPGFHGGYG